MSRQSAVDGGIGVLGLLGVAFVTLKLCGVITWSWLWVTAPFWLIFAIPLAALAIIEVAFWIVALIDDFHSTR